MTKLTLIKPAYQRELFETVYSKDPAIDLEQSDLEEYKRTRDLSHLRFIPGEQPTKYFLRLLPQKVFATFTDLQKHPSLTLVNFFQMCVAKIENLHAADGSVIPFWEPTQLVFPTMPDLKTISDEDLERLFDDYPAVFEIGDIAIARHFLHKIKSPDYLARRF